VSRDQRNAELFRELGAATRPQERIQLRRAIVENNLAFVRHMAGRDDDAFQAGVVGLYRALDRFDPSMGFRFITYAATAVLRSMRRDREYWLPGRVRMPSSMARKRRHIAEARQHLSGKRETPATVTDIAAFLGETVARVEEHEAMDLRTVTMCSVMDLMPGEDASVVEDAAELRMQREKVSRAMARLGRRERVALQLRMAGHGLPYIGTVLGISGERARQLGQRAAEKIAAWIATPGQEKNQ
jgi:RNA polymerase sigma factor (sigma-70 family)